MESKGFLNIPFSWLFAIIAGIFILGLAIYATTKIVNLSQFELSTENSKTLGVLLNPLETGFESSSTTPINLATETRIYNECNLYGNFGKQIIKISQKNFGKWPTPSDEVEFQNKYLFSDEIAEGKTFYLFSKPFEFPFKVSDLIYITSSEKEYCFKNPPEKIKDELTPLNQKNILVNNCSSQSIIICFSPSSKCDIEVNYLEGYVEKDSKKSYFETDALMYAAVFSTKENYECQLKRLMKRTSNLAILYKDKSNFLSQKTECNMNLNLLELSNLATSLTESSGLTQIYPLVNDLEKRNNAGVCPLW